MTSFLNLYFAELEIVSEGTGLLKKGLWSFSILNRITVPRLPLSEVTLKSSKSKEISN